MKAFNFSMTLVLILALPLFVFLPGCGENAVKDAEEQVEKVESGQESKEDALKKIDEQVEKLAREFEDGDVGEEEFIEKMSALERAQKELTREEREKHWEEESKKMRSQYEGYLEKEEREKAASGN